MRREIALEEPMCSFGFDSQLKFPHYHLFIGKKLDSDSRPVFLIYFIFIHMLSINSGSLALF